MMPPFPVNPPQLPPLFASMKVFSNPLSSAPLLQHPPTLGHQTSTGPRVSPPVAIEARLSSATYVSGAMDPSRYTPWLVV